MKNKLIILALAAAVSLHGQSSEKKIGVQAGGGINQSYSDLGNGFFNFEKAKYGFAAINFGYYLSPAFDLNLGGTYGEMGLFTPYSSKLDMLARMETGQLTLKYKLYNGYVLGETGRIRPYLYIGGGAANFDNVPDKENRVNGGTYAMATGGAGISFMVLRDLSLTYNLGYIWNNTDELDFQTKSSNDQVLQHSLMLGYNFGTPRDDDKDGINNSIDQCPKTPSGVRVTFSGCPVDEDNDGIADYLDNCPNMAGVAAFHGCPDTDGDGIADSEDNCPTISGLVSMQGCPDSDNDGITDASDNCPTLPGSQALNGCPDQDGDLVADPDDNCPTLKGLASLGGCPDSDNDGISDRMDACPTVPGIVANRGCPELKAETKKVLSEALRGIQFESGKDVLKKSSYPILNDVLRIMNDNPEYNLEINGHTDSQGDEAVNLHLSQHRCDAVKNYLTGKGISDSRLKATGFGETQPVETNSTAAGRAKNRRVEFKVTF
jgi:outer membrane protein OmpA-like peptidoglycan-associated protein